MWLIGTSEDSEFVILEKLVRSVFRRLKQYENKQMELLAGYHKNIYRGISEYQIHHYAVPGIL